MPNKSILIRSAIAFAMMATSALSANGQIHLPQLDIEAKGGFALIDAGGGDLVKSARFQSIQGAMHVQFNQRIALGGFYSKGIAGEVKYKSDATYNLDVMMYGIDLRISAGRSAKWRPYIGLVFGQAEFRQQTGSVYLASKSTLMGANLGIMLRFGRNFYWNVLEVSPRYMPDKIWWINSDFSVEAKSGFLYNIRLKSK
jgi:hypothetical protein